MSKFELQKQIISIYKKLDRAQVFHGDANLLNYMCKGRKLYIIDFGMAKQITPNLIKKLGTETPNMHIMTLGLALKLRDLKYPKTCCNAQNCNRATSSTIVDEEFLITPRALFM